MVSICVASVQLFLPIGQFSVAKFRPWMQPCEVHCALGNISCNCSSILPKVLEKSLLSQGVGSTIAHHCAEVSNGQCHLDLCWFQCTFRLIPRCIARILCRATMLQTIALHKHLCYQINHETIAMKITNANFAFIAVGTRFGFRDRYVPPTKRLWPSAHTKTPNMMCSLHTPTCLYTTSIKPEGQRTIRKYDTHIINII